VISWIYYTTQTWWGGGRELLDRGGLEVILSPDSYCKERQVAIYHHLITIYHHLLFLLTGNVEVEGENASPLDDEEFKEFRRLVGIKKRKDEVGEEELLNHLFPRHVTTKGIETHKTLDRYGYYK